MEENIPLKKKRAATKTEIGRELQAIYENDENGEPTDLGTIERAVRQRRWPKLVIATFGLFILAAAAWAGIARFGGSTRYGDNITITIDGPVAPRTGDVGTWAIHYQNNEGLPLAKATLKLNLPLSFTVVSSDPQLIDAETRSPSWNIGTIAPGAGGTITVKGRVLDAVGAPIAIQTSLTYRPANFNADFEKPATWSSRIADAAVEATFTGPDEAVPGDDQTFTLTVTRRDDLSLEANVPDLKIRFDPDQLIVVKKSVPDFSIGDARTWISPAPKPGKPLTFTVTGSFAANTTGSQTVNATVGALAADGNFMSFVPTAAMVNVLPGDLVLTLIRNGSNNDAIVGFGETMHVSIDYQNSSAKAIGDAEIALTVAGTPSSGGTTPVDWNTLDDIRAGKKSGNTLTWTKKEIPDLGSIPAGGKGSIDISFKTVSSVFTTSDRNYNIDLSARGTIGTLAGKKSGKTVSTPVMGTLISSDARVSAASAITPDSPALAAGQTSTYRVIWVISNSLHEIGGIKVTAQLPENATFVGKGVVEAGDLQPPDASGKITWTLDRLPTSFKSISADFTVSVAPPSGKTPKNIPLLGETILTATDKTTSGELSNSAMALTTASGQ